MAGTVLAVQACAHCINWFSHCCCNSWVALLRSVLLSLRCCNHCDESLSVPLRWRQALSVSRKKSVAALSQALELLFLPHCAFSERQRLRQASASCATAKGVRATAHRLSRSHEIKNFGEGARIVSTQSH